MAFRNARPAGTRLVVRSRVLIACLAASAAFSAIPTSISAQVTYEFERMWPTLQQPWYFGAISDAATAPDGSLFIADVGNAQLLKFGASGQFLSRGQPVDPLPGIPGIVRYPGITVGPDGTTYLLVFELYLDSEGKTWTAEEVQRFNSDGGLIQRASIGTGTFAIAAGPDGSVFLEDNSNDSIMKFDASLRLVDENWHTGFSPGRLTAAPNGTIYGIGSNGDPNYPNNIRVINADSQFLDWNIQPQAPDSAVGFIANLTVGSNNKLYVTIHNGQRLRVYVYNELRQFERAFDTTGGGRILAAGPVSSDSEGRLFGVQNPDTFATVNSELSKPEFVSVYDLDGNPLGEWSAASTRPGQFVRPGAIALGAPDPSNPLEASVYVADAAGMRVQKFNLDGVNVREFGGPASGPGALTSVRGIGVSPDGSIVYVADPVAGAVRRYSSAGSYLIPWDGIVSPSFRDYGGLTVDSQGFVYVSSGYSVTKISPAGSTVAQVIGQDIAAQGNDPFFNALDAAPNDTIYVVGGSVQTSSTFVWKFDSDLNLIAGPISIPSPPPSTRASTLEVTRHQQS